ncbi:MAG: glycoside hydrolase family 16 protein, partial [Chitinophagaceae bacterium]
MISLVVFLVSCKKANVNIYTPDVNSPIVNQPYSFVDKTTPLTSKPMINGSTTLDKWQLAFSDEFNDMKFDTLKWSTENRVWYKGDINVFSTGNEVEEKDGNVYLSYFKSTALNSKNYYVGRFNSKDKYSTTYGFFETRMHVVKPNGYQTAFWLMPNSGTSMSNAGPHDGTANDGAEIDIIEGNKLNTY